MVGDSAYEVTDRLEDSAPRVLRRVFVIAVVLVFVVGFPLGTTSTVIGVLVGVLALLVELLLPRERLLARASLTVAGTSAQAESAFAAVYEGLRERAVPGEVRPRRVRAGGGGVRSVLTVQLESYRAVITVAEFGGSVALSWTVAQRQLPVQAVVHWLATSLGAEPARDEPGWALADAIHAAVRNGAETVESGRQVSVADAFGYDVPVEDRSVPAPPPPRPTPPPPVPSAPSQPDPTRDAPHENGGYGQPAFGGPYGSDQNPGAYAGVPSGPVPAQTGHPSGGSLIPGLDDAEDRTALIPPPPRFSPFEFSVGAPVEVYTPEGAVVGRLEPGTRYWAVDEHPSGLVVQIAAGAALLRDRNALRRD